MKFAIAFLFAALSTSAFAAATHDCEYLNDIGMLIEQKPVAGGGVKVAYVSTEEPAAAPDHVLVFIYDNQMGVTCTAISRDAERGGFGYVDMRTLKSVGYDAAKGRLLSLKVHLPDIEGTGVPQLETIKFRVNQKTGKVTLE